MAVRGARLGVESLEAVRAGVGRGMNRAGRITAVMGLAALLFVLGATGLFTVVRSDPREARSPRQAVAPPLPVLPNATLAQTITALQARLRAVPSDWPSYASLGLAYVQQARVMADPSYYPKAQGVLQRSMALHPNGNFPALTGLGALALARHDFAGALSWGRKAVAINPYNDNIYGVIGDAQVELGRYDEAFATFQKMVDLKPNLASYARASYAHELQGDVRGAVEIMNLAYDAAGTKEDQAWVLNQLGELSFNSGNLDAAEENFRHARVVAPSFVPAEAGLAKVEAARGRLASAIRSYRHVVAVYPLPEYVIALGDLYRGTNQEALADREFDLLHVEERLFQANGVNMDLEIALFDADHHVDLAAGLKAAEDEYTRRRSVNVADALAWELFAHGRAAEALTYANEALHLGTRNALFFFHRGMIERALGQREAARGDLRQAIDINPHFSVLWAEPAARALASVGGKV
jgi:tetratricopeptide (TPR) repeat protein